MLKVIQCRVDCERKESTAPCRRMPDTSFANRDGDGPLQLDALSHAVQELGTRLARPAVPSSIGSIEADERKQLALVDTTEGRPLAQAIMTIQAVSEERSGGGTRGG